MVEQFLLLALATSVLVITVLLARHLNGQQASAAVVTSRLDFPRDMHADAVVAFLGRLGGLLPPWHRRLLGVPVVVFEVSASSGRIAHYLSIPSGRVDFVLGQLHSALPGVRAVEQPDYERERPTLARELRLTSHDRPLRTEPAKAISASLLASLQPLHSGERVVMQWLIAPTPPAAPIADNMAMGVMARLMEGNRSKAVRPDREDLRAARAKQAEPLFAAVGRLGVSTSSAPRAGVVMARLIGALHATNAPGVRLRRRLLPSQWVAWCMERGGRPFSHFPNCLKAIRLEDSVSAQLSVLAQLEGTTVAELIRQALEALIETKRSNPELTAKASGVLAAIEAEASTRKQAIEALLMPDAGSEPEPQPAPKGRSRKNNGGTSS